MRSAAFVVTQKPVLQQSKNVTAKCTETLLPPPSIQFSLVCSILSSSPQKDKLYPWQTTWHLTKKYILEKQFVYSININCFLYKQTVSLTNTLYPLQTNCILELTNKLHTLQTNYKKHTVSISNKLIPWQKKLYPWQTNCILHKKTASLTNTLYPWQKKLYTWQTIYILDKQYVYTRNTLFPFQRNWFLD